MLPIVGPTRRLCMCIGARIRLNFKVYHDRAWPLRSASGGRQYSSILLTSGRHINIMDLHQRNKGCCSGTIIGTLLLFMFTKKASTVVNFDVDIIAFFTHLASVIFNSPQDIRDCFFI